MISVDGVVKSDQKYVAKNKPETNLHSFVFGETFDRYKASVSHVT